MNLQTFEFRSPLRTEDYRPLLESVAKVADLACFVISGGVERYNPSASTVIADLTKDLVRIERDIDAWPGTLRLPGGGSDRYVFELNQRVITILSRAATSLYAWHNRDLPDDLHFLRSDGSVVLGSIGHEHDAWLELTASEHKAWIASGYLSIQKPTI